MRTRLEGRPEAGGPHREEEAHANETSREHETPAPTSGAHAARELQQKWQRPAGFWLGQLGELPDPHQNVEIVLEEPKYSGNIGSVARSMANMGFTRLCLLRPRTPIDKTAYWMAKEGANVLLNCRVEETLENALEGASLVVGMTRRRGRDRINAITAEDLAHLARGIVLRQKLAVLLGSEDQGLGNDTLSRCHWLVKIPGGSYYDCLNLSHAATILCYELNKSFSRLNRRAIEDAFKREALMAHLQRVLRRVGFLKEGDPVRMMLRVREILGRAQLDERDLRILHGILDQIEARLPE